MLALRDLDPPAVDPYLENAGAFLEERTVGHHEVRALAPRDRAELLVDAEHCGRRGRQHRQRAVPRQPVRDRAAEVLPELAALGELARRQRDGDARLIEAAQIRRRLLPRHHLAQIDRLDRADARHVGRGRHAHGHDERALLHRDRREAPKLQPGAEHDRGGVELVRDRRRAQDLELVGGVEQQRLALHDPVRE
ncbi:MAG: hypothetical protein OER88_01005, partial [Planctomycetota bacterium]|nr:hypothetical protein [Planctomycetota bacterium]